MKRLTSCYPRTSLPEADGAPKGTEKEDRTLFSSEAARYLGAGLHLLLATLFLFPWAVMAQGRFCPIAPGVKVPCPLGENTPGPAGQGVFANLVLTVIDVALLAVGSVSVLFLIYGGYRYITAHGNEEQAETAKRVMRQAILGIVIVILSFAIIAIITNILIAGRVLPGQ